MPSGSEQLTTTQDTVKEQILKNRRIISHRFFLSYAYDLLRHAKLYVIWQNILNYFRKIRMVALILKILSIVLSVLQTGALVLLSTLLFLVILPIFVALMLGILLTALLESRKSNARMKKVLKNKQVYILFLPKQESSFFEGNIRNLAQKEKSAVIVVSPYWISGKGLASDHFFCTVRNEGQNIYLVRRYYFFMLKKHVLGHNVTYIL